ncbi:MAG: YraN family protein [Clostridia bacterium]|nr:YraN family protein [Clostridia bacterium]
MKALETGRVGEKAAAKLLRKNKYKIINKNLHVSHNEIDIIAENKEYLVFVEVKTRSVRDENDYGFFVPSQSVTKQKRQRTITAARAFLSKYKKLRQPRFDVIEVYLNKDTNKVIKINHIINAFGA